jgi:putative transposon-encoded protein
MNGTDEASQHAMHGNRIYPDSSSEEHTMSREIKVDESTILLKDEVEVFDERRVTKFGNFAELDASKKYIGRRAYVKVLTK